MNSRLTVLEIVNGFAVEGPGGGASRFGIALSQALDRDRFDVSVAGLWDFGMSQEGARLAQLPSQGIEAYAAAAWDAASPYHSFWSACRALRAKYQAHQFEIIHSHSEFGDVAALYLGAALKARVVLRTVHNGYRVEWRKRPVRRLFLTNLLYPLLFTAEIGVNEDITARLNRRSLARLLGRRAVYIPNAIQLGRFSCVPCDPPEARRRLDVPEDAFLIGAIGRLAPEKGYDHLIRAAGQISREHPQVYFLIAGEGELSEQLATLVGALGLNQRVRFTGPLPEIERFYPCLDLFVSASLWEGVSTAILESMAAGVPVVGTDIPGNRGLLQDQVNSWVAPAGDPAALAGALRDAFRHPENRAAFAARASETVQAFSIENAARRYEELFQSFDPNAGPRPARRYP
jgi:glycosyltransferase involved in cell wall biosynthesis